MRLKDLIKELKGIEKEVGDVEVYHSKDSEGNSFGTINKKSLVFSQDIKVLIIYPFEEYIDLF